MRWSPVLVLACAWACTPVGKGGSDGVTPATHTYFPITAGPHALDCATCHPASAESFADFTCVSCHTHDESISNPLHLSVAGYQFGPQTCLSCHPKGEKVAFDHAGITTGCALCHDVGAPFVAVRDAKHPALGGADCSACHHDTTDWNNVSAAPDGAHDPNADLALDGYVPTWSGTSIVALTPVSQTLPSVMNHGNPAATGLTCGNCHANADQGQYYPGVFHASLDAQGAAQPTACVDCHVSTSPSGFVGPTPTSPPRSPASGEMRHEAVAWDGGVRAGPRLVPDECGVCHAVGASWAKRADAGAPLYHQTQLPGSCIDCHANTRPVATVVLDGGLSLDHQRAELLGECRNCHSSAAALAGSSWAGGEFHATVTSPTTCLPCHEGERPTSTTGWQSATYQTSPFDYVTNARGARHGANQDCAMCHASSAQTWVGGHYGHDAGTPAETQCITCHMSQRPDLNGVSAAAIGFDHAAQGSGDCFGCHQATWNAGTYVHYSPIPGSDWQGGVQYPSSFISSNDRFITVTETSLLRSGPNNLITGTSSVNATLFNGMLHTSPTLPPELALGPVNNPDYSKCWHCHQNVDGGVTTYTDAGYHTAYAIYRATPGAPVMPLPPPTSGCSDCHQQMLPQHIVQPNGTNLQPMDHASQFTTTVNIGGKSVSAVSQRDCSTCHSNPGVSWADGAFHSKIGAAVPRDCAGGCHYPLMADTAKADITQGTTAKMAHGSLQLTFQSCETCHGGALGRSTTTPLAAGLWRDSATVPAHFHGSLGMMQPSACVDCHAVSLPSTLTQGSVVYMLAMGSTATNQAQFMSHQSPLLAGTDCALCHRADAKSSGAAWSPATKVHGPIANAATCRECHAGNVPSGLTDSTTVTTSSVATTGTHDQLTHTDLNVSGKDCKLCHTQQGQSSVSPIMGREWAQAAFHKNFTAASPLVTNGTTARCSNCHLNVRPALGQTAQDHTAYTATSTTDCSQCHTWPGTSTTTPNWKGATGAHASSGSTAGSTLDCASCHGPTGTSTTHLTVAVASHYGGVTNGNTCISCHIDFSGFTGTIANLKYAHTNAAANAGGCVTCHTFSGQLYTTLTTTPPLTHPTTAGGHQFSQTFSVTGTHDGQSFTSNHTNTGLTKCGSCHRYSTTTSTTNIWAFTHDPSNPGISNTQSTSGCTMCH